MDSLCRLCGSEEGIKVNIFEPGTEHVKKIHKILPITVNEHDPLPKNMCHRCSFKVNDFFEFRTNCIKAQELFKSKVPWLREKQTQHIEEGHPPMVEVTLNSVNAISPNEKRACLNGSVLNEECFNSPCDPLFIDENEPTIVIDDDSPPYRESSLITNSFHNELETEENGIFIMKKTEAKKKTKRSIWDTKRRKKKARKSCKIAEVFTTTFDEYQNIGDIENDPLGITSVDSNESRPTYSHITKSPKHDHTSVEKGILTDDKSGDNIVLPKHILITNIPRVGNVFTCEKCGRTFLSPQPANLHMCDEIMDCNENDRPKEEEKNECSNTNQEFYNCNECGKVFTRHSQLLTHEKKHNEVDSSSDDSFKPFKRRKKHKRRSKQSLLNSKPPLLETDSFLLNLNERDSGIARHSLLSSDSE